MAGSEDGKVKTWYVSDISPISVIDECMASGVKVMTLSPNNTFLVIGQYSCSTCSSSNDMSCFDK